MKIEELKIKMLQFNPGKDNFSDMYEELEASYQQLLAMSEQLSHTDAHFSQLIKNMRDIVWVSNNQGEIQFINEIVSEILGYSKDEMIGRKLYEFMCPLHEYRYGRCKDIVALMNELEFNRQEMWMLHKDGNTRKVLEVNTKHIKEANNPLEIQGVGRDITDRIQIERKLAQKNRHMEFVSQISASITQNLSFTNLDQLIEDTCKNIVTNVNVPLCTIRIKDSQNYLILKAAYGRYKSEISSNPFNLSENYFKTIMKDKQPLILTSENVKEATQEVKTVFNNGKIKNLLILPLNTNESTVGIMAIGLDAEFSNEYTSLFASLSNNLAFAIEKSRLYQNLKNYYMNIIMTLVAAMEAKDTYTQGHSLRVSEYAVKIAKALNLSKIDIEEIEIAGILHDIGKIGISDYILGKPGCLTKEEFDIIKTHPTIGMKILDNIGVSSSMRDAILYHHLRYDLKGYPENTEIKELPLFARIIGVADALDAMTSNRSYKKAMNCSDVKAEFSKHSGHQFCPNVVEILFKILDEKGIIPLNECFDNK
ncbi:HD domain-containing phosphohydrolase [Acetoanaerobium noterae]|uniref:HD domain-containing phosphohydrolase n=1 Tax=Acetoanaerobium noterae TaxID=745369 RepID=UPI003340F7FD